MTARIAHNGFTLPEIGFGTYLLNGAAGVDVIDSAISVGYRLLDSAFNYENEGAVGRAARNAEVSDLIVTSKLPGRHHAYDEAITTIQESVYRTGLEAIPLYLIHWPNPKQDLYVEAWRALIEAQQRGWVHQIGVSNFLPEHLDRLERETGVLPVVNQLEIHPYFPQQDAITYAHAKGIIVEAWSPVGRGTTIASEPVIEQIAETHEISPFQVILAWHVARGVVPLPKSSDERRQRENLEAAAIVLTDDELAAITALGRPDGRLHDQDPARYEEF